MLYERGKKIKMRFILLIAASFATLLSSFHTACKIVLGSFPQCCNNAGRACSPHAVGSRGRLRFQQRKRCFRHAAKMDRTGRFRGIV